MTYPDFSEGSNMAVDNSTVEIDIKAIFALFKRRNKIFLFSIVLSLLIASLYCLFSKRLYRETLVLSLPKNLVTGHELITYRATKSMIDLLNLAISEGDYKAVARLLNLEKPTAELLREVQILTPPKKKNVETITLEIYSPDREKLNLLEKAIVRYLDSNPQLLKTVSLKKQVLQHELSSLNPTIASARKLSSQIQQKLLSNNIKFLGFNPIELKSKIFELKETQIKIIQTYRGFSLFSVLGSVTSSSPVKPSCAVIIALGLSSGVLLGIVLCIFAELYEGGEP